MAINSTDEVGLLEPNKPHHKETNPERTLIQPTSRTEKKVGVIYFLSRNGKLEHPHFMEVPLFSPQGLYLRDVISTFNLVRGQGMAEMYSWSSKRSYKNGFVWQDLSGNDFIEPCHGHEYILKGSPLIEGSTSFGSSNETISSSSSNSKASSEMNSLSEDSNSFQDDLDEHKVYKAKTTKEFAKKGVNESTRTVDDNRRLLEVEEHGRDHDREEGSLRSLKKSRSSSRSFKSSERSIEVYGSAGADVRYQKVGNDRPSGRINASSLLMKLISCGSKRF